MALRQPLRAPARVHCHNGTQAPTHRRNTIGQVTPRLGSLLLTLMYPAMLVLLVRALTTKVLRRWELALLHMILAFSFALLYTRVADA